MEEDRHRDPDDEHFAAMSDPVSTITASPSSTTIASSSKSAPSSIPFERCVPLDPLSAHSLVEEEDAEDEEV